MQSEDGIVRTRRLDEIAEALPQRASCLTRLFLKRTSVDVSRTEASVLRAVAARPQRITELAAAEGLTQPAITFVVNRLQDRQWVARTADPDDRRAVLVSLTPRGRDTVEQLRSEYQALIHEEMATLGDEAIESLAGAIVVLDDLIARLQERAPTSLDDRVPTSPEERER